MILRNSTQAVGASAAIDRITELEKDVSFALVKKSIENQIIKEITPIPEISAQAETNSMVLANWGHSVQKHKGEVFDYSEVTNVFGFRDTQKYSGKTQRWEGQVLKVDKNSFSARLEDLTNPGTHEIMDFDLEELSPDDLKLLTPGASFYFSVGFSMSNGQREKKSLIRFKRIPCWSESEYDRAADRAAKYLQNIKWD